jgi:Sel1 repeat
LRRGGSLLLVVLASSMALPARADRLDDDLNTLWEATWDQRGTPLRLLRWEQPIRYRLSGADAERQRDTVLTALKAVADVAGVSLGEAPVGGSGSTVPNLEIEIVGEHGLAASIGCEVQRRTTDFAITHATARLRASQVWQCVHHEAMHVMGIPGHPSGRTVLSYFPWRRDTLLPMDKLLLAAWYDRALPRGATPLELLWTAGLRVVQQPDVDVPSTRAHERRQAHYDEKMREMASFARGEGDVPTIIKRSGRASPGHIEEARALMGYYLGLAHQRSVGVPRDDEKAVAWFGEAAKRAHHPSQVFLARALIGGVGIAADPLEAHRWLASAAKAGNTLAPRELQSLEKSMDAGSLEKARALGPR